MEIQKSVKKAARLWGFGSDSWPCGCGCLSINRSREDAERFEAAYTAAAI